MPDLQLPVGMDVIACQRPKRLLRNAQTIALQRIFQRCAHYNGRRLAGGQIVVDVRRFPANRLVGLLFPGGLTLLVLRPPLRT